jgi:hypothetical protein
MLGTHCQAEVIVREIRRLNQPTTIEDEGCNLQFRHGYLDNFQSFEISIPQWSTHGPPRGN